MDSGEEKEIENVNFVKNGLNKIDRSKLIEALMDSNSDIIQDEPKEFLEYVEDIDKD